MEHDEVKLKELISTHFTEKRGDQVRYSETDIENIAYKYASYIRKKTLEEVRGLVPNQIEMMGGPKDIVVNYCAGHDKCREQILSAIDTLSELNK